MKDRLLTIGLSIAATLLVTQVTQPSRSSPQRAAAQQPLKELVVDRLIVHRELIVSDTGEPWDAGFERQEIPRGMVARSLAPRADGGGGYGSGPHQYALIAIGPQGRRSQPSPPVTARGFATLAWDSLPGADAYILLRDGRERAGPLRIEGSEKRWRDEP